MTARPPLSLPRLRDESTCTQKLDRLDWVAGMSIEAYGVRVGLRVNDALVLKRLPERFPFGWKRTSHALVDRLYSVDLPSRRANSNRPRFGRLHADSTPLLRNRKGDDLLDALESDLRLYVAEHARRRVFVHAGVVGWKGRAILIPGRSNSGKTTLVAELIKAGATYYSDEYALLDAKGRVHPFAKPLSIRDQPRGRQTNHTVESLGGVSGRKVLPVGLVVVCRWNGKKWRPRVLSPGLGSLELMSHTVSARRSPAAALRAIQMVVSTAPIIESSRAEASDAATAILEYAQATGW